MLVRSWQQFYSYIFTNTSNNGLLQGKQFVTPPQQDTNVLSFNGIVTRVARRVPHVEQELPTLPEHMNSHRFLVGFAMFELQFSVQYFVDRCLSFFHLSIVLSVLLRFMDSDLPLVSSLFLMPMLCFFLMELAVIKRLLDFSFKLNINLFCVLCENHFYCEGTSVIIFLRMNS